MSWKFPTYEIDSPLNWEKMSRKFSWIEDMKDVAQDPLWHAEGDVFVHTQMVLESLIDQPEFKLLSDEEKHAMVAAALLHDVEKRSTTQREQIEGEERITSPGHAKKGEYSSRDFLYRSIPSPFPLREEVAKLVRLHGLPIWAIEKEDPQKAVILASLLVDTQKLALLARADVLGRICPDQEEMLLRIEMFEELCKENDCFGKPKTFKSAYGRYEYLNKPNISPDYEPFEDHKSEVILMSALPGSGKDYYINRHFDLPVLSLDDLRRMHKVDPRNKKKNGQIIQLGKEKAKEFLRARQNFVYNATNISSQMRGRWVDLFVSYGARVKIVYVEVPFQKLLSQNKNREYMVPEIAIAKMMGKWEIPSVKEAHEVLFEVDS
ncbi:MAG: AAA family ATPase [Bacteroidia bacterium]|nr:AAA family ATPase [Bacteroidia bacterium]